MTSLIRLDECLAHAAASTARRSPWLHRTTEILAAGLAPAEVALMFLVGARGSPRAVGRMLAAVTLVYVATEAIGRGWPRPRPFARPDAPPPLVDHAPHRSFPSRHVASAWAMATIAGSVQPGAGSLMGLLALMLGLSRIGAGLHYPSDVLGGLVLGQAIGRALRQ